MGGNKGMIAELESQRAVIEELELERASSQLHWKRFFGRGFGAFFLLIIASRVIIGRTGESKAIAMLPLLALAWIFFGGIYKGVRSAFIIRRFRAELFKHLGARLAAQALPGLEADPAQDVLNQECAPVPFAGFNPEAVLKGRAGGREVILVAGEVVAGRTQEAARPATLLQWRLSQPWPDDFLAVPAKGKGKGLLGLLDDVGFRTSKERRQERQDRLIGRYDVETGHAAFDQAFRSKATSMEAAVPPKALLQALLALGEKTQGSFAFSLRGDWASLIYRDEALFWPAADWFYEPLDPAQMAKDWDGHAETAQAMAGLAKALP